MNQVLVAGESDHCPNEAGIGSWKSCRHPVREGNSGPSLDRLCLFPDGWAVFD